MMTGGKKVHTEDERTYREKKNLEKLALGAASVMVGTGLYAGHAAGVKADTNNTGSANDQAAQQNDVQQTGVRATANQAQQVQVDAQQGNANQQSAANQATGQAVQLNASSPAPQNGPVHAVPASEPAQQAGKEIDSNDYETDKLNVVANNGLTADTHGRVALTTQLRFRDPTKINNGDYLDFKLGAPTTDGKYIDYASSLMPDQDIILTNQDNQQVKVGEIHQMDAGTNTAYYRLIFNDQLKTFISPTINLQLLWNSMIQSGVMLRLYTQQAGQSSPVTLMNDLKIGSDVTTAWIQVPVIYVPSSGHTQQAFNLAQNGYGAAHVWTTDVNGNQQLSVHGMDESVNVWLADNLSNKITVTIHGLADNPYFETSYMIGDQVAQQIENAIKQQGKLLTWETRLLVTQS